MKIVTILLQPRPQPGPLPQQRLVGDLDGRSAGGRVPVERQQPGPAEPVDHLGGALTNGQLRPQGRRRVSSVPSQRETSRPKIRDPIAACRAHAIIHAGRQVHRNRRAVLPTIQPWSRGAAGGRAHADLLRSDGAGRLAQGGSDDPNPD